MRTVEEIKKDLEDISTTIVDEEETFFREKQDATENFRRLMSFIVDDHFDRVKRLDAKYQSLKNELVAATAKNGPPNRLIG